ncbi:hypothetical protein AXF42_Ash001191 [Apostasia shenzhenica]|uniref:Chloroplast protein HCF243 n=1 Tax=Apostasia shenzhenica TaxID=1088818 RepID=A0A2I0AU79_9ASPA|nr:hypothetical protein AXF42_Ash001191 [Apostasia shenzhenica]
MSKKQKVIMEAGERSHPHRRGSSGGGAADFFICFTARPSSSSSSATAAMRVSSSKGLMSPGRGRDSSAVPALSSSLSRRLRSSGSVKGGQSPMFPAGVPLAGRKKGCAFEAAEPSSPKVTCIGQVRVKAKKKGKFKTRAALARARSQRRESSFRREERGRDCFPGRNQRWVHQLPISICEAVRAIGSEFNCFVPCGRRSICGGHSSSRKVEEKASGKARMARSGSSSSRGAVQARWLMAVQDSEVEKRGEVFGLVVEESEKMEVGILVGKKEEKVMDVEEVGEVGEEKKGIDVEEEAKVSVCIPPRNALLLMRCRSDPVRMAALANRFWGSPAAKPEFGEMEEEEEKFERHNKMMNVMEDRENCVEERKEDDAVGFTVKAGEREKESEGAKETLWEDGSVSVEDKQEFPGGQLIGFEDVSAEKLSSGATPCREEARGADGAQLQEEQEKKEERDGSRCLKQQRDDVAEEEENGGCRVKQERSSGNCSVSKSKGEGRKRCKENDKRRHSFSSEREVRRHSFSSDREGRRTSLSVDRGRRWSFSMEKEDLGTKEEASLEGEKKKEVTPVVADDEDDEEEARGETGTEKPSCREENQKNREGELDEELDKEDQSGEPAKWTELPDCLLMMMYEPKLSMEVSKETWVCGKDFLQWRPHQRVRRPSNPAVAVQPATDDAIEENSESADTVPVHYPAPAPQTTIPEAAPVVLAPPLPPAAASLIRQNGPNLAKKAATVAPYEPLILTRCKSEPMRSSARLAPDACFWKDRHRPIGAAGVGF